MLQPRTAAKIGPSRPSGEDVKLRLQVAALEKDLKRATDKVARLEQARLDANADKQDHTKEIQALKAELRKRLYPDRDNQGRLSHGGADRSA